MMLLAAAAACRESKHASSADARALEPTAPVFTAATGGYSSKLLGRATFTDPKDPMLTVKRITGDWHVEVKAKPSLDVAVQTISFPAGSSSGWHRHPGPVFILVTKGTIRFYEGDDPTCTPIEKSAGQGFLDRGEHAHIARNESDGVAETAVTVLAPEGAALKIDADAPGNCPF
jgi:quercetin dioxygenase-like cupin family protein